MLKDFTPKSSAICAFFLLAACGVPSFPHVSTPLQNAQQDPALAALRLTSPVLEGVTVASGRDIVVRLESGVGAQQLQQWAPRASISSLSPELNLWRLQLPVGQSLLAQLQVLQSHHAVRYAEPNPAFRLPEFQVLQTTTGVVQPNDTNYGLQWNMKSSKIDAAWALSTGNPELVVAVIDSGVDPDHPDLVEHLLKLEDVYNEEKGADLYRNPVSGQLVNYGGRDGNGHGTHVAGIIAATMNNNIGVAGVAGGGVKILPIKATDASGNTDAATLTAAFQRAIDRGAKVINISIGGPASKSTKALVDVINRAVSNGITVVSATGNESDRANGSVAAITVPAAYANVIAVGAHTEFNRVASYSNGGDAVDLVAPGGGGRSAALREGQQIWSTWPSYNTTEFFSRRVTSTFYAATAGTSMACPHVSGVVALLLAREPRLTPAQIRSRLAATADDIGTPGFDSDSGYGKLNALRALQWTEHDAHD